MNIMVTQKSKLDRIDIHRSHLNGVRRWLWTKGGRERFEKAREEEFEILKSLTRRNHGEK